MRRIYLTAECLFITFAVPILLYIYADHRWVMLAALWGGALVCGLTLLRTHKAKELWHGQSVLPDYWRLFWLRFGIAALGMVALTWALAPDRLFQFPLQRPQLWAMVMLLYPVLSAIPQEIIYRSFFFERYEGIVKSRSLLITLSAVGFGLSHIMMENLVAPLLSIIGGYIFADSYACHRSLKWVSIEHALYGCVLFTIGLGWFFYYGNWR